MGEQPHQPWRGLRRAGVCLLVGVLCTVASAWALAAVSERRSPPRIRPVTLPAPASWPGPVPKHWPATPGGSGPRAGFDRTLWVQGWGVTDQTMGAGGGNFFEYRRFAFGLPLPAMHWAELSELEMIGYPTGFPPPPIMWGGWHPPTNDPFQRLRNNLTRHPFPLVPWWPGFIFNVLFYGGAAYAVLRLRDRARARRLNRGLCPRCRYPLGVSPVCTECGANLVSPPPATAPPQTAPEGIA